MWLVRSRVQLRIPTVFNVPQQCSRVVNSTRSFATESVIASTTQTEPISPPPPPPIDTLIPTTISARKREITPEEIIRLTAEAKQLADEIAKKYNLDPEVVTSSLTPKQGKMSLNTQTTTIAFFKLLDQQRGSVRWQKFERMVRFHINEPHKALLIFDKAREHGQATIEVYNTAIEICMKNAMKDRVIQLWNYMREDGVKPELYTFGLLLHLYSKRLDLESCMDVITHMKDEGLKPRVQSFNIAIANLVRGGKIEDALKLYEHMQVIEGTSPNSVTNAFVMDGLFKAGRPDEAMDVWRSTLENRMRMTVVSYGIVLPGMARNGLWVEALKVFLSNYDMNYKMDKLLFENMCRAAERYGPLPMGEAMRNLFIRIWKIDFYPLPVDQLPI